MNNKPHISLISEGSTEISVFIKKTTVKGPGKKGNYPFYNPSMELNRDLSVVFNQWYIDNSKKTLNLLDGLAASGIRGIRFANELEGNTIIHINDWSNDAYKLILKNIRHNNLNNIIPTNKNLNIVLNEKKFDYIDIDPFGSPINFIDSAIRNINRNGIIACTATDTATLCGVFPKVCFRRYGAYSYSSYNMKEIGLRILIGFLAKEAARYDKGIKPIICYSTDYYFRIYIKIINGVNKANESLDKILSIKPKDYFYKDSNENIIGPLWMGEIGNNIIIKKIIPYILKKNLKTRNKLIKLLDLLEGESDIIPFFYSTETISSKLKISSPKMKYLFNKLNEKGYYAIKTHFSDTGFKTNAPIEEIEKIYSNKVEKKKTI
jgi:tRNA (guanine26-N2/guanine27-N2)-dimethyltransferase